MNTKKKLLMSASLILVLIFISSFLGNAFTQTTQSNGNARAQTQMDQATEPTLRTVSVSGVGEVQAQSDQAVIRLGVQTENESAQAALDENNTKTQSLMDTLDGAGISPENIQTHSFQLVPHHEYDQTEETRILVGYRVSNIVEVRINDMDALGVLLDLAVDAGANTIQRIRFEISDMSDLADQARDAAVQNARRKAEQLASLAGATLGPVLEIQESSNIPEPVTQQPNLEASSQEVPVQPGTRNVRVNVLITWQIQVSDQRSAAVVISPTSGQTGTDMRVNATGFPPNVSVELGIGHWGSEYEVVQTAQTDRQGALSTQVVIPDDASPGEEWVVVVVVDQPNGTKITSNRFYITE